MKTQNSQKIEMVLGTNATGYVTDFRGARKNARLPEVGSALFVAVGKCGQICWSERRAMHINQARKLGFKL